MQIQTFSQNSFGENTYLVMADGRDDAVVIDPGVQTEIILQALEENKRKLAAILLTHGHFDHVAYGDELRAATGAKIHIHQNDAGMLKYSALNASELSDGTYPVFSYEADSYYRVVETGDLAVAGLEFVVVYTPGHTPGGVMLYLPDEKTAFTGDTLFCNGFGRADLPGGSMLQLRRSLKKLFRLPKDTVIYPGHGDHATMEEVLGKF